MIFYENRDAIDENGIGSISSLTIPPLEEPEVVVLIFFHVFVSLPSSHVELSSWQKHFDPGLHLFLQTVSFD